MSSCEECAKPYPRDCPICGGHFAEPHIVIGDAEGPVLNMREPTCGGGWTTDGPPCGGCNDCLLAQAAQYSVLTYGTPDQWGRFWICNTCGYGVTMPEAALRIAHYYHHGQAQQYDDRPYIFHVLQVMNVLREYGHTDPSTLTVAALHDIVEDTTATDEHIRRTFGPCIADDVATLTDGEGTRAARKAAMLKRLKAGSERALVVKFADRVANTRMSVSSRNDYHMRKHRQEHPAFRALATSAVEPMALELDRLLT